MNTSILSVLIGILIVIVGLVLNQIPYLFSMYNIQTFLNTKKEELRSKIKKTRIALVIWGVIITLLGTWELIESSKNDYTIILIFATAPIFSIYLLFTWWSKNKTSMNIFIVIILCLLIYPIFNLSELKQKNNIFIDNKELVIEGRYGIRIPLNTIRHIEMVNKEPSFVKRTNGFSLSEVKKGYFLSSDNTECLVFIDSSTSPYVYIHRNEEVPVIINLKDREETVSLYKSIMEQIK